MSSSRAKESTEFIHVIQIRGLQRFRVRAEYANALRFTNLQPPNPKSLVTLIVYVYRNDLLFQSGYIINYSWQVHYKLRKRIYIYI
jgi:hypothetical protein